MMKAFENFDSSFLELEKTTRRVQHERDLLLEKAERLIKAYESGFDFTTVEISELKEAVIQVKSQT